MTVTVHEPDAGMVPAERATLEAPAFAVTVPAAQLVAPAGVAVLTRPAGYTSVKAAPVTAVEWTRIRRDGAVEECFAAPLDAQRDGRCSARRAREP